MDWDKLRIFHAVAEAGSFTHAGETLNLSQSAISRQISTLEESLGVSLFHRHARGLILTEQGQLLEQEAREIFSRLSMIEGQLHDSKKLPEGPLRITTTQFIGSTWLAPQIEKFCARYPDIQLTMLFDNRIYDLGMREADAAIRLYKPEHPDLIQKHMKTIHFHIYASRDYLAQHDAITQQSQLKKHMLIGYPPHSRFPFKDSDWLFRISGLNPDRENGLLMMNSMYAIYQAVRGGAGLAALPDYLAENDDTLVRVLPDLSPPEIDMYFVYPEEYRNSKRLAIFRDFVLDLVNDTNF